MIDENSKQRKENYKKKQNIKYTGKKHHNWNLKNPPYKLKKRLKIGEKRINGFEAKKNKKKKRRLSNMKKEKDWRKINSISRAYWAISKDSIKV